MRIEAPEQKRIIAQLILNPNLSFNQLADGKRDTNLLAYHLNRLVKIGVIAKDNQGYRLSAVGKSLSAFLDSTGEHTNPPTVSVVTIIKDGQRFLCQERLKEPFRGYVSFISGNLSFGTNIIDSATHEVKKQSGLTLVNARLKGTEEIITFEGDEALYHHLLFIVEGKATGDLVPETRGKRNMWLTKKELYSTKLFPKIALDDVLDPSVDHVTAFGHRFIENGEFIGGKTISKNVLAKVVGSESSSKNTDLEVISMCSKPKYGKPKSKKPR